MEALRFTTVLLLILPAGAFGGVAELLRHVHYAPNSLTLYGLNIRLFSTSFFAMLVASAFVGAAGALGVHFVFILLKSFSAQDTVENLLLIASISVAAGFGARTVLPGLVSRLQRQIEQGDQRLEREIQDTANEFDARIRDATGRAAEMSEFLSKITTAAVVTDAPPSARQWAIDRLTTVIDESSPTHRSYNLILGRLHKLNGDSMIRRLRF